MTTDVGATDAEGPSLDEKITSLVEVATIAVLEGGSKPEDDPAADVTGSNEDVTIPPSLELDGASSADEEGGAVGSAGNVDDVTGIVMIPLDDADGTPAC